MSTSISKPYSEISRLWVHVTMIGFALFIGRWNSIYIVLLALSAFLFNLFFLPNLTSRRLERPVDRTLGFSPGLLLYPISVLILSLIFYDQQIFTAIGWAIMAFGDPAAHITGKRFPMRPISWNPEKSWGGTLAFWIAASLGTTMVLWLLPTSTHLSYTLEQWFFIIGLASGIAAVIESIPGLIDDNVSVPISGGISAFGIYALYQWAEPVYWPEGTLWATILMVVFMGFAIMAKKIDIWGGLCGVWIGMGMFLGGGVVGVLLLMAFFGLGTMATSWRIKDKLEMGLAEKDKGRRSISNALSNGGMAGVCGYLAWLFPDHNILFQLMMAASMASATADTLASELGNVYGRRYVDVWRWKKGLRGEDGVISLEGTLLGALGAILIASFIGLAQHNIFSFLLISIAGILGNYLDSFFGATLQRKGFMNNHTVNFANTLLAALFAGGIWLVW